MHQHKQSLNTNPGPIVLVTGATGAIGPSVIQALYKTGYRIRTLSRNQPQDCLWQNDVEVHIGDITDQLAVQTAMQNVEFVIHLAALLHIINPPLTLQAQYQQINVDGTANVVNAAVQAGVKRLVFFSTIAVYGDTKGQIINEDVPPRPDTFYAKTKLAAEQVVLSAKQKNGQPLGTVLRMGAIYGTRVKGNYQRLAQSLAHGRFIPIGHGLNRRTLVHEYDAAQAAVLAIRHPAAAGQIYNISDGQFHTLKEIINAICTALNRTPPQFSIPIGPTRFIAGAVENVAHLLKRKPPIGPATIDKYTEDVAVESKRIQTELGFTPQFDLRAGWQETIRVMQENGNL